MSFLSLHFVLFTSIVFCLYYLPIFKRYQLIILVIASLWFFGCSDIRFLPLLITTVLITHVFLISSKNKNKKWLGIGILFNLLVLAFFKYKVLVIGSEESTKISNHIISWLLSLPLPIGISFFIFHNISYLVDFNKNKTAQTPKISEVLLYIGFFPQLVSGPITRAQEFFPQIENKRFGDIEWVSAVKWIISGFFMKSFCANNLGAFTIYLDTSNGLLTLGGMDRLFLLFMYSFQIYADFFGYTALALGLGLLFGYRLPVNFNIPYISESLSDFWHRWHISLSRWLKTYLYIPLGGNREGVFRTYCNLIIVMALGGLWHGASWNYMMWGMLHGAVLCLERAVSTSIEKLNNNAPTFLIWLMKKWYVLAVFCFVSACWMLFKMTTVALLISFVQGIISNPWAWFRSEYFYYLALIYAFPVLMQHLFYGIKKCNLYQRLEPLVYSVMLFLAIVEAGPESPFIYFQF